MFPLLLATAAVFSCLEAQQIVDDIPRDLYTDTEFIELVEIILEAAPHHCDPLIHILPNNSDG